MKTITQTINTYTYQELSANAQEVAIDGYFNDDFTQQLRSEDATVAARDAVIKLLSDRITDINWDTCSAGFVRRLEVDLELPTQEEIEGAAAEAINDSLNSMQPEDVEQEFADGDYMFLESGKLYQAY